MRGIQPNPGGAEEGESGEDDATLVARAVRGRAAFGQLYDRYAVRVFRYCYRRLGDRELAEDATSHIFIKALQSLPSYRETGSFVGWLFAIAFSTTTDLQRRRRPTEGLDDAAWIPDSAASPEEVAIATDESVRPDYTAGEMNSSAMLFEDLPGGEPAPPEVTNAIQTTISEMTACSRPGYEAQLASYYSDDYFRRRPVTAPVGYVGNPIWVPELYTEPFESATVLADGRIAVLFAYDVPTSDPDDADGLSTHGNLVVWAQVDGRWVIDEVLEVGEGPIKG